MVTKPKFISNFRVTQLGSTGIAVTALVARDLTVAHRGQPTLSVHANDRLDYDQAMRLRNWLNDWLGLYGNPTARVTLG